MKELFYEVIKEASNGAVFLDGEEWPIGFNTIIYDNNNIKYQVMNENNLSTLVIRDEKEFLSYLDIYLNKELSVNRKSVSFIRDKDRNRLKLLISYLFVNASMMDFSDPISYLKRRIQFLDNGSFLSSMSIPLRGMLSSKMDADIYLEVNNVLDDVRMETPYKMNFSIVKKNKDGNSYFHLPSVSYGICEEYGEKYCYIYSILNSSKESKDEEEEKYRKKISRMLYKMNQGDIDADVKDVSVSSVLSLSLFLNLLSTKEIHHVKGILYLPVRYLSRDIMASSNTKRRDELLERNDQIQRNVTDKFFRTFRRVSTHIDGVNFIDNMAYDNGYIDVYLDHSFNTPNVFLDEVIDSVSHYKLR